MAARPDGLTVGARRREKSAGGSRWLSRTFPLVVAGLSLLGGCQKNLNRQSIESDRFLDQYAAGRGLTRDQARDEVMAKLKDKEEKDVMNAVEDQGVVYR